MTGFELVADLTSLRGELAARLVAQWSAVGGLSDLAATATIAIPPAALEACTSVPASWRIVAAPIASGFWDAVLSEAGRQDRAAMVLMAPVVPGAEALGVLLDLLDSDPMFGATAARVQCWDGCCLQSVARLGGGAPVWIPMAVLADLPAHELLGDVLSPYMALAPVVLTDFGDVTPPLDSLSGMVIQRLIAARRCGFRTALANRAVVRVMGAACDRPAENPVGLSRTATIRLRDMEPEFGGNPLEWRGGSLELFEKLTGQLLRSASGGRPSLLLDMRNVRATFNGTTAAALGAAYGLHRTKPAWDIAVLAHPAGAGFHDFAAMFPGWPVYTSAAPSGFTAALRLSQPWHIEEMVDLHLAARLNAYLMLDTIAWDVQYVAPAHLDGTWRFLSAAADGLLFISEFSRQRFRARFPKALERPSAVCHLSFDPADYTRPELLDAPDDDYILVVGNHLDHKDVGATVGALASAFPFQRIEALGPSPFRSPRIASHPSGSLAESDMHRLYAAAKLVVFPSFYEGFGLPVVTALAYGRTLCARESPVLTEVAAQCRPRGRVIPYRHRDELIDIVGRLLHGRSTRELPVGAALNGHAPRSWAQMGVELERFLQSLIQSASAEAWRLRDDLVSQAMAYRTVHR
jgi:glycosyltransferase involved in cell wall biosynthesis